MSGTRLVWWSPLIAAILLAGCAPVRGPVAVSDADRAAFRLIVAPPPTAARAEAGLIQQCLRQKGFAAPLPRPVAGGVANLPVPVEATSAPTSGYGDLVPRGPDAGTDALTRYTLTLPPAERTALTAALDSGTDKVEFTTPGGWRVSASRRGCVAQARAALYGSVENWLAAFYLPQDLNSVASDSYLDEPVRQAAGGYHACMAGGGYSVDYPQDAVALAETWSRAAGDPDRVPDAELRLATADVGCRDSSGLTAALSRAFEARSLGWLARNTALVRRAADALRTALGRAAR